LHRHGNRLPGDLSVGEISTAKAYTCGPDDEIHEALETMAEQRIRRLPVVDKKGAVRGVVSMDDILLHADLNKWEGCCELSSEEVIRSLKRLHNQQVPPLHLRTRAANISSPGRGRTH